MVTLEHDGTVEFMLWSPGAESVSLVGTFDGWHEDARAMTRGEDGMWRVTLDLLPGEYLFRYRVDDERWVLDESAHGECVCSDGTRRSRLWRPALRLDPDSLAA